MSVGRVLERKEERYTCTNVFNFHIGDWDFCAFSTVTNVTPEELNADQK